MPIICPLYSLCDHGDFEVHPWKEGGCQHCKEQGLKRYHAVRNGNYKFITFGKRNSEDGKYKGDVMFWQSSSNSPPKEEGQVIDRDVKLLGEDQLVQYIEVTERYEEPEHYSTDLNSFWSMIYHYGSIEKCIETVEENEWVDEGGEDNYEQREAFSNFFSDLMDDYDDYDDDEEDDLYYDDEEDDDIYYEDSDEKPQQQKKPNKKQAPPPPPKQSSNKKKPSKKKK
ncbi:predicted protein [Naegleria gruberi]|uniref:Predicted protein n=1 Tax=Naegleria gruberi TaxID=5762 RepID=D2VPR2_NAEGR|nr:uncharacterized protein NAEGRDRAFT_51286 [Naegleria gruberi]EFC41248.1 predicted protein [Naegleria gruberi]|eukprot:XP_002673992.1 predicted protein [Naegleria gruberi strain NEG-M]